MHYFLLPLAEILSKVLFVYTWVLGLYFALQLLTAFKFIKRGNPYLDKAHDFARTVVEPLATPLRKVIPTIQGIDLSVPVIFLVVYYVHNVLCGYILTNKTLSIGSELLSKIIG